METIIIQLLILISSQNISIEDKILQDIPSWDKATQERVINYSPFIQESAQRVGFNPNTALSIAWTESHFNPHAKSYVGAKGIMQIMPKTQEFLKEKYENSQDFKQLITLSLKHNISYEIAENIILGNLYLKELENRFDCEQLAIVAYNMGPTWVRRQLNQNYPIGQSNHYLNKVNQKLVIISSL